MSKQFKNVLTAYPQVLGLLCSFATVTLVVSALCGSFINLFLDEGIYLHGAQRVLRGEALYRDWLGFIGPGTDWTYAAAFALLGNTVAVVHGFLAVEIGLVAAAIYAMVASAATDWRIPIAASLAFAATLTIFPNRLYINHRWDSLCWITLGIALLLSLRTPYRALAAGIFIGAAGATTPPTLLIGLVTVAYLLLIRRYHATFLFVLGLTFSILAAAAVLMSQHALVPMLDSLKWAGEHYSRANSVPYGYEPSNPAASSAETQSSLRALLIRIPAALPFITAALLYFSIKRKKAIPAHVYFLFAVGIASVLACYPRWAANQLLVASPFFFAAIFLLVPSFWPPERVKYVGIVFCCGLGLTLFMTLLTVRSEVSVATQLGEVLCRPRDQASIEFATAVVQPGESLFVFPYQPIWYSLTGGINPTYYDFLQPGMMTREDESRALSELQLHPPDWVIWHSLPPKTVLAIWPNSDPATLRFTRIEQFILTHYRQVRKPNPTASYSIAIFGRKTGT